MNTLLHALKHPDIQEIIRRLNHARQGVPETLTFRDIIKSRVWLMGRIRKQSTVQHPCLTR